MCVCSFMMVQVQRRDYYFLVKATSLQWALPNGLLSLYTLGGKTLLALGQLDFPIRYTQLVNIIILECIKLIVSVEYNMFVTIPFFRRKMKIIRDSCTELNLYSTERALNLLT